MLELKYKKSYLLPLMECEETRFDSRVAQIQLAFHAVRLSIGLATG